MLNRMRLYLISKYGHDRVNNCFGRIQDLIIKTMEAVQKVMHTDRNHSFELYGFDVLLDSKFQPWLLEINAGPLSSPASRRFWFTMIVAIEKRILGQTVPETRAAAHFNSFKSCERIWQRLAAFVSRQALAAGA